MLIQFDHFALLVADLESSRHFYGHILGLKEIERPIFPYPGAWFSLPNGLQLHLISGRTFEAFSGNRGNHYAFRCESVMEVEQLLMEHSVEIVSNKLRVDGVRQLFAKDPDGYFIEFNEGGE